MAKGEYLLVMPAGGKSFRYDYKLKTLENSYKNGTFVYGLYPETTLSEAQAAHVKAHKLVAQALTQMGTSRIRCVKNWSHGT